MEGWLGLLLGLQCLVAPAALEHSGDGHEILKLVTMALPFWTIYFSWDTVGFLPEEPFTNAYERHAKWVQGLLLGAYICLPAQLVFVLSMYALGHVAFTLVAIVMTQGVLGLIMIQYRGYSNGAIVPELRPQ